MRTLNDELQYMSYDEICEDFKRDFKSLSEDVQWYAERVIANPLDHKNNELFYRCVGILMGRCAEFSTLSYTYKKSSELSAPVG